MTQHVDPVLNPLHQRHYHTRLLVHQSNELCQTHAAAVREAKAPAQNVTHVNTTRSLHRMLPALTLTQDLDTECCLHSR